MFSKILFKFFLTVFALLPFWLFAQSSSVFITNSDGISLEGASIHYKNLSLVTDENGLVESLFHFPARLIVTYVGMETLDTTITEYRSQILLTLKSEKIILDGSIITASWANDNSAVTQKTVSRKTVYSGSEASDMPSLLSSLPGSVSTSDAGNNIGYSGLRIRGSDQTRINVMIDGVPVNDAESQNVFWVDLPDLIEDIQNIQIQRGVGISTAGPGAFGANINLRSGFLSAVPVLMTQAGFGSFNTFKLSASGQSGTLWKYFRFKVRGSMISSDGYIDRASSDLNSGSIQAQYIRDKFSLTGHFYLGKERTYQAWNGVPIQYYLQDYKTTYNPSGLKGDGTFFDDETDNYTQIYNRLIGRWVINPGTDLQFTLYNTLGKGYYNQYREDDIADYFPELPSQDVALIRERWLDNSLNGINVVLDHKQGKWTHQLGGNFQYYHGRHFGIIKNERGLIDWSLRKYYDNPAKKQEASLFARSEFAFKKFNYFIDLQLRQLSYHYEGLDEAANPAILHKSFLFFNPKLGSSFLLKPDKPDYLYIYGGVANKEPNRDDFKDAAPGKTPRPERLYDFEFGYKLIRENLKIHSNIYYMYYKNHLLLTGQINDVGAYTRFNVDKSYRAGIEVDLAYRLNSSLEIHGNLAVSANKIIDFKEYIDVSELVGSDIEYLDQEVVNHGNSAIGFSPAIVGYGEIGWFPFKASRLSQFKVYADLKHVSSQYLDNSENSYSKLPAYRLFGAGLAVPIAIGRSHFNLDIQVKNLFDRRYVNNGWTYRFKATGYDPAQGDPYIQKEGNDFYSSVGYFPQAGRNFYVGLRYTLK